VKQTATPRPPEGPRWAARWADHQAGPALLALFAALEAFLFPAPTEALMLALCLGKPRRSWRLAAVAVAASLAGALAAYAAGRFFFDEVGRVLLDRAGLLARFEALGAAYSGGAFWLLATSGYTPVPYLLYTISAGAYRIPLPAFIAGALVGRALKYFLLGTFTFYLGPPLRAFIARRPWIAAAAAVLAMVGFLVLVF
jgi:membrane protein YqaA with SNARE-associated domain